MKEKIKNEFLRRKILSCLNKNDSDDFSEEELATIENISLSPRFINGRETGLTVRDIFFFDNLKSLTLRDFQLSMEDMQIISERVNIENLSFISCGFEAIDFDKLSRLPENLRFVFCDKLPKKFPRVKSINVELSSIDFESIDLSRAINIFIINSKVNNACDIDGYDNIRAVDFYGSILYGKDGQELKNIKVSKNTRYSHEEKKLYETGSKDRDENDLER